MGVGGVAPSLRSGWMSAMIPPAASQNRRAQPRPVSSSVNKLANNPMMNVVYASLR